VNVPIIQVDNRFSNVSPAIRPYPYGSTSKINNFYVRAFGTLPSSQLGTETADIAYKVACSYQKLLSELHRYGIQMPDYQIVLAETRPDRTYSRDIVQIFAKEVCGPNLEVILRNPLHPLFQEAARSWIHTCESLIAYYADSLDKQKPHLYDIARPCQYIFSNPQSVLIDLDPRPNEPGQYFKDIYLKELFGIQKVINYILQYLENPNDITSALCVIQLVGDLYQRANTILI